MIQKTSITRKIIISVVIILVIIGSYFGYKALKGDKNEIRYTLAKVEKGTLISSVSGSGQVSASDQVDIKPKVSGELAAIYIQKDQQEVKTGQLLATINTTSAQRSVTDAKLALESAQTKLEELLSPPDSQDLLQAENAVAQAERDLEKAQNNYDNIGTDTEKTLADAYESGYNNVSTIFFKLSDYIKDLKDVLGTEKSEQEYISSYKLILGRDSPFIQKLLDDYSQASDLYSESFTFFRGVSQTDSRDTIYKLINDTLETTKAVSQALQSTRDMYDAITTKVYTDYYIFSTVDKMQPKIESDLTAIFSSINTLQQNIDTIDNTVQDTPDEIKDSELALKSAQEKLAEIKLALEELKAGADPLDIKTQRNLIAQKQESLITAQENLANCYVYTPFGGVITSINTKIKKGDSVSSSTVLATLLTKQKIAEISLNEIDAAKVKVGQKATVTFDAIEGLSITGEVVGLDTIGTVTQGVVTYNVKINFDTQDERIKPGMSVSVSIITEVKQDVLLISNSAVKTSDDTYYTEILDSTVIPKESTTNKITITSKISPQQQLIQIGSANDSSTEIISGLKEGDWVVTGTSSSSTTQSQQSTTGNTFRIPGIGGMEEPR